MTLGDTIRRAIAWADAPPATIDDAQAAAQERTRQFERGAAIDARFATRQAQADADAAAFAERRAARVRTLADQADPGRTLRSAYAGALQAWRTATEQRAALASELAALGDQLPTDDKAILAQVRRANTIRAELPALDGRIVELAAARDAAEQALAAAIAVAVHAHDVDVSAAQQALQARHRAELLAGRRDYELAQHLSRALERGGALALLGPLE